MKRIVCILTSIFLSVSVFCSCSGRKYDAEFVARSICDDLCFGGVLYSSLSPRGEEGYLPQDLLSQMFISEIPLGTEVALVLLSSAKVTYEVGVFYSFNTTDSLLILELAKERLSLLESYDRDCCGSLVARGGYIIYAFSPSANRLAEVLDGIF